MGWRRDLMKRAAQRGKSALERVIGESNLDGSGPSHGERTAAWPPGRMGTSGLSSAPEHPADIAADGRFVEVRETQKPAVAVPETTSFEADFSFESTGSVAQSEWFPPPRTLDVTTPEPVEATVEPMARVEKEVPEHAPDDAERITIKEHLVEALHSVYDPEIPVDIYELGLIYDVDVTDDRIAEIKMTLTSPNCPAAQSMPAEVEQKTGAVDGVRFAKVDIVWDPPWGPERMSEAARLELNID